MKRITIVSALTLLIAGCPGVAPDQVDDRTERTRLTQDEIDSGQIALPDLMYFGRNLSIRNWRLADGFGRGGDRPPPNINRMTQIDSTSCMSCHGLGNGVVLGWGNNAGNVLVALDDTVSPTIGGSNERNTPAVHGLALLELLAKEISIDLRGLRDAALEEAAATGAPVTQALTAKRISFGTITARPDGTVDTGGVEGIDADLRIRPFHAKGHEATIRIFTRGALNRHHGIQSDEFLHFTDPTREAQSWDEDGDGVVNELTEGELTAMTVFQVCMPIPQEVDQDNARIARGRELMETIGCTACHLPAMRLDDPTWRYTSAKGVTLSVDLTNPAALGSGRPVAEADGSVIVRLWGDLKRHDLGPEAHEPLDQPVDHSLPNYEGGAFAAHIPETLPPIPRELMLTTELWGVRDTGPWWHDGSSPTIEDAILRHGGEAQPSRDAFAALTADERNDLLAFLNSLQVAPVSEILVTANPDANL